MGTVSYLSVARARRMGLHRPAGRMALVNELRQEPGAGLLASNAGPDRLASARRAALVCLLLLPLVACVAKCSARASEPPRRQPDVPALLGELDRIEGGIVTHEIAVRDWRLARTRVQSVQSAQARLNSGDGR